MVSAATRTAPAGAAPERAPVAGRRPVAIVASAAADGVRAVPAASGAGAMVTVFVVK